MLPDFSSIDYLEPIVVSAERIENWYTFNIDQCVIPEEDLVEDNTYEAE